MSIGTVMSVLQPEFPALTVSKLRFLEEQGLVSPSRTTSGYRKYSQRDVERLRYTLTAQRDSFLPLRVIRDQLEDLDAGRPVTQAPGTRVVARDGELVVPPAQARVRAAEISDLTGASLAEIQEMTEAGVIVPDSHGRYPGRSVQVVILVRELHRLGLASRNLRAVRTHAERQAAVIDHVVAPLRAQRSGQAQERARVRAQEIAELVGRLHTEFLRSEIHDG